MMVKCTTRLARIALARAFGLGVGFETEDAQGARRIAAKQP